MVSLKLKRTVFRGLIGAFIVLTTWGLLARNSESIRQTTKDFQEQMNQYVPNHFVNSLKSDPILQADPVALKDSQWMAHEAPQDEEYISKVSGNPLPADPKRDFTIKIPAGLGSVTSEQFLNGDPRSQEFIGQILELIEANGLSHPLERRKKMKKGKTIIDNVLLFSEDEQLLSEKHCWEFFDFPDEFVADVKAKHKIITDNLPNYVPKFYQENGYVIVGGGKYTWFALLVIEVLRHLGSILPVEVILPTPEDYDPYFCETLLKDPHYNARCVQLHKVFGEKLDSFQLTGYQYKAFAILASSFENAFLLDSDTYPVINPDRLFDSKLYKDYNMITWPDYWRRTTSPVFYQIQEKKIGKRVRHLNDFWTPGSNYKHPQEDKDSDVLYTWVPFHDRAGTLSDWTTESGEMIINKRIHFKTLLLALYYNYDGQFGYYPLLSQGGAGEGDKETFVAAAHFYDLKYYQLYKKPDRAYGFIKEEIGGLCDTSIIQYDPVQDYKVLKEVQAKVRSDIAQNVFDYDYTKYVSDNFQIKNSRPMFYHVHETKLDPFDLLEIGASFNEDKSKHIRNLGGDWPRFNFDLELFLWNQINKYICVSELDIQFLKDKDGSLVCGSFIKEHLKFLRETNYDIIKQWTDEKPIDNLRRYEFETIEKLL